MSWNDRAGRAQARGGVAAAAAFLQRAVGLTADPGRRTERALAAAESSFQAGAFDTAQRLLAMAESSPLDGFQAARAALLRGHVAVVLGYGERCGAAAPAGCETARSIRPRARSRGLPDRVRLCDVRRASRAGGRLPRHLPSHRRPSSAPGSPGCQEPPAGRARTDAHRRTRRCDTDLAAGGERGRTDARRGRPAVGVDSPDGQPCDLGLRRLERDLRAPGQNRSRRRCACGAAGLSHRFGAGQGVEWRPGWRPTAHCGERHRGSGDREPAPSDRGAQALVDGREGSRRLRADRGHDRTRHRTGAGAGGEGGPVGGRGPLQRPRPLRRGGGGSAPGDRERHRSLSTDVGAARARRGGGTHGRDRRRARGARPTGRR